MTALLLACAAAGPAVLSAEEIGVVTQPDTITGRDGGGSARVFGSSVWTSGDTVLATADEDGATWHNNSYTFATLPTGSAADGIVLTDPTDTVGAPRQFMAPTAFEAEFNAAHSGDPCAEGPCGARWVNWPGTPQWDPDSNRAFVTYAILYLGDDEADHVGGGHSVAVWSDVDGQPERPVIDPASDSPDMIWGPDEHEWGTASAVSDGYFWVYACDESGWDRPCRLARAPVADAQVPDAWTYWDGRSWSQTPDDAVVLFDGAPIMSLGWNDYLAAWLVVYSPPFAGQVKARTAPDLTGPWSRESVLFDVPEGDAPYDANHHPELAEQDGKVEYITWSRHTTGWFGSEFALLRVEFK